MNLEKGSRLYVFPCVIELIFDAVFIIKERFSSCKYLFKICRDQDSNLGYCGHNAGS